MAKNIKEITLYNFKAFYGENTIKLDGKNLLLYGENGSGKSSIYWALYTLLQSSTKNEEDIKKYFEAEHQFNESVIVNDNSSKIFENIPELIFNAVSLERCRTTICRRW